MQKAWQAIVAILAVLAFCTFLVLAVRKIIKMTEHPQARRRVLLMGAAIYAFGGINVIFNVVTGNAPWLILCGLPIPAAFVWFYLKSAAQINARDK